MDKLRQLFYQWAFLDIHHTGRYSETFFSVFEEQNSRDNLEMVSRLSLVLALVALYVSIYLTSRFPGSEKYAFHLIMMLVLVIILYICERMIFQYVHPKVADGFTVMFICLLYGVTIANRIFGFQLPGALIYLVMALVPVAFVLPPLLVLLLNLLFGAEYLLVVYTAGTKLAFYEEALCTSIVLVISTMMGYYINRTRAEQAFTNQANDDMAKTLKASSMTDQLTGLLNHRSFQKEYYTLFESCQNSQKRIGVIMFDIDKFKLYNDYYGHMEGDNCLSQIGQCIGSFANEEISAYRFGGEEFVLLLKGASAKRTIAIAETVRAKVQELAIPHEYGRCDKVVTVSVGVHLGKPGRDERPMDFFDRADQAMYQGKRIGGNQVSVFHEDSPPEKVMEAYDGTDERLKI